MARQKSRLTITLSPDLLDSIDRLIERHEARNRSQAIELLARRGLEPAVTSAVVLAGGKARGKALPAISPIDGEALIVHLLRHLRQAGIRSFVVLAGDDEPEVRRVLEQADLDARWTFVTEERPLGTAGALRIAEQYLGAEPFLVVHGDVLTDIDIGSFIRFHRRENALATMAVKPRKAERHYGKVYLEGNRITEFLEEGQEQGIAIVNTGVYLFEPTVLSLIDDEPTHLETEVFPLLARMGELSAFFFQGIWYDISTPENYRLAQARWKAKGGPKR